MKYCLGTAQFGLDYGVTNQSGKTPPEKVSQILHYAKDQTPFTLLDTAHLYGDSESVLGNVIADMPFQVITKSPVFEKSSADNLKKIQQAFEQSLSNLSTPKLYAYLIHRGLDLLKPDADTWVDYLVDMKRLGKVEHIGISAYTQAEITAVFDRFPNLDIVQVPVNLLDQRLVLSGLIKQLSSSNIKVHARSIFLQGVLLSKSSQLPAYFEPIKPSLAAFERSISQRHTTHLNACLDFIQQVEGLEACVLGCNSLEQLVEINRSLSTTQNLNLDYESFAVSDSNMLNPSNWNLAP